MAHTQESPPASAASFIYRMRRRLSDLVAPDPLPRLAMDALPTTVDESYSDDVATPRPSAAWNNNHNHSEEGPQIATDDEQFYARMTPAPQEFQVHRAG